MNNKEILAEIEAINERLNRNPLIQKQIPFSKYHWEPIDKYSNIYQKTIPILPHVFIKAYIVPVVLDEEYDIIIKENDLKILMHEFHVIGTYAHIFRKADKLLKEACVLYVNYPGLRMKR